MSRQRLLTAFSMTLREFLRRRGMILFMILIPVISFASVYVALPDTPVTLDAVENGVQVQVDSDQVALFGGVMALIYVAILAGITGFYVMTGAVANDRRLILAGCTPLELVAARCMVLLVLSVGITALQLAIMLFFFTPNQFFPYTLSLFWAAMVYGIYGGLFATLIRNELGGLLAVVFFANFDVGYFQLPGYSNFVGEWWLALLPGYFPVQLAIDAGFTSVADYLLPSFLTIPHAVIIAGLMLGSYSRATRVRPFLSEERRRIPWWAAGAAVLAVILIGAAAYFYWSAQPATVSAEGRMDATSARVVATTTGRVSLLTLTEGQEVDQGQSVAWITDANDGSLVQLTAPLRGRVAEVHVRQEENVVPGEVLAEIYQTESLLAYLEVDENSIGRVAVGQAVELNFGGLNLTTNARVVSIALTPLPPDPTVSERTRRIRNYVVKAELDELDPRLLVGMAVTARVFTDAETSSISEHR
jgi:hypothetical protein